MNSTNGGHIPGHDASNTDDKVSLPSTNGVSATAKPREAGESPADVTPAAKTTTVEAKKMYARCAGLGSAFSRSPEQTWQDPPGFYGNENYGFEWERWAQEQERKRLADTKH